MTEIHRKQQVQIHKGVQQRSPRIHKAHNTAYDPYKHVPKQVMEVAEGLESQFTNHLLREMRKTSGRELGPAENIYQSMLDAQRAEMMSQSRTGVGIKDLVIEQLDPNFRQQQFPHRNNQKQIQNYQNVMMAKEVRDEQ